MLSWSHKFVPKVKEGKQAGKDSFYTGRNCCQLKAVTGKLDRSVALTAVSLEQGLSLAMDYTVRLKTMMS